MKKEDIFKKIKELLEELENKTETKKLEFEEHNFKINSNGWKKIMVDKKTYLENQTKDIWEILDGECKGEQLFTWDSAMRETKKRGKTIPIDENFTDMLEVKADIPNLALAGYCYTDGSFYYRASNAYLWSSSPCGGSAWGRYLYSGYATVTRNTYAKAYGLSVRCLKNLKSNMKK